MPTQPAWSNGAKLAARGSSQQGWGSAWNLAVCKSAVVAPDAENNTLRHLSGGLEFAVFVTLAALLGTWIDARLNTSPWFLVALLIVGFAGATWLLLRSLAAPHKGSDT